MKLVIVQDDYINYLKQYSKDVKENKNASRPYVGVILKVGNLLLWLLQNLSIKLWMINLIL